MQTWIDLPFADGTYTFKLGLAQIAELERKADAGLGAIYARCVRGRFGSEPDAFMPDQADFRYAELVEVIRQGLIGGASGSVDGLPVPVSSVRANDLIQSYVLAPGPTRMALRGAWGLAYAILHALIQGYTPPGEAGPAEAPADPAIGSTSQVPSPTA